MKYKMIWGLFGVYSFKNTQNNSQLLNKYVTRFTNFAVTRLIQVVSVYILYNSEKTGVSAYTDTPVFEPYSN